MGERLNVPQEPELQSSGSRRGGKRRWLVPAVTGVVVLVAAGSGLWLWKTGQAERYCPLAVKAASAAADWPGSRLTVDLDQGTVMGSCSYYPNPAFGTTDHWTDVSVGWWSGQPDWIAQRARESDAVCTDAPDWGEGASLCLHHFEAGAISSNPGVTAVVADALFAVNGRSVHVTSYLRVDESGAARLTDWPTMDEPSKQALLGQLGNIVSAVRAL